MLLKTEAHIFEMHDELDFMYLSGSRYLHFAAKCHKAVNQSDTYRMSRFIAPVAHVMPRAVRSGHQHVLMVPRHKTSISQRSYSYRRLFFWNLILSDIRSEPDLVCFKWLVVKAKGPPYTRLDHNHPT